MISLHPKRKLRQKSLCLKGFSLIELLTIIGIMGILFLIGFPAFRIYRLNLRLSGAVRDLVTDLRYVQQLAVTEQIDHGIRFSTTTEEYEIIRYTPAEEILEEKSLPEEVSFEQISGFTNNEAKFNPYGAAAEAGDVTLTNSRNTTTIEVRASGFVKTL